MTYRLPERHQKAVDVPKYKTRVSQASDNISSVPNYWFLKGFHEAMDEDEILAVSAKIDECRENEAEFEYEDIPEQSGYLHTILNYLRGER